MKGPHKDPYLNFIISGLYNRYLKFQQFIQLLLMYADDTTLYCCLEDIDNVNIDQNLND